MKKDRIFKVRFETNEGVNDTWASDEADVLEEDGEKAIAKMRQKVEKRGATFRLRAVEELARADY
jgi:hypothetical protein